MNNKILQKVIEELKKKEPSIPYVLGMLETLAEMGNPPVTVVSTHPVSQMMSSTSGGIVIQGDEHRILDAQTKAKLANVMDSIKYE